MHLAANTCIANLYLPRFDQVAMHHTGRPEVTANLVGMLEEFLKFIMFIGRDFSWAAGSFPIMRQAIDAILVEPANPSCQRTRMN